jgi:N-methylhydantoinase A
VRLRNDLFLTLVNDSCSYTNSAHEEQARAVIERMMPHTPISISAEVLPEMYEYERALTTVANSYIRPNVEQYLANLQKKLGDDIMLRILRSDGGLCSQQSATLFPVNLLMSGPAGGVAGVVWVAKHAGYKKLLTLDMGGTSTDVALIYDGAAKTRKETKVGDMTVRARSLDVQTVGAGGGSIAHVPTLTKALRVGPQSAGARPGPACYGHGGTEPTVTDANVVLGYLPAALLGGEMKLDLEAASTAIHNVASALGLSDHECASGIYRCIPHVHTARKLDEW